MEVHTTQIFPQGLFDVRNILFDPLICQCPYNFTLFEKYSKCRIGIFKFWHFPPIFVLLKLTCLVTMFDRKLQVFKNSSKWTIFGIFNQLLSTQNVNVVRFARNVE